MALGAGYVNSWAETFTDTQVPCIRNVMQGTDHTGIVEGDTPNENLFGSLSTCAFWLVAGLIVGSLRFQKKQGQTQ